MMKIETEYTISKADNMVVFIHHFQDDAFVVFLHDLTYSLRNIFVVEQSCLTLISQTRRFARDSTTAISGSVRAHEKEGTVYVGKLMVHPDYRHRGYGTRLLNEIERYFPKKRLELFTSILSVDNIRLYQRIGYQEFECKVIDEELEFVYIVKHL